MIARGVLVLGLLGAILTVPSVASAATSSKNEVVVANVSDTSDANGAYDDPGVAAITAFIDQANAEGGINGHKIKLITVDDRGDSTLQQSEVQNLVQNDHVVAFVADFDGDAEGAAASYLDKVKVPVIGGEDGPPVWWSNTMYFPFGANTNYQGYGYMAAAKLFSKGKKLGTMACVEAPGCATLAQGLQSWGSKLGYTTVYQTQASISAPNYTAQCLLAKSAGVQVMALAFSFPADMTIASNCEQQGLKPVYVVASGDQSFEKDPLFNGYVTAAPAFPPYLKDAQTQPFLAAMKKYEPSSALGPAASMAWVVGLGLQRVLSKINGPVTSAKILDQLWTFKNVTFGGLSSPITFVKDKPAPITRCSFPMEQVNGKMTAPDGLKEVCAPS